MKKILLIATGGTIASADAGNGLTPELSAQDLLRYAPGIGGLCELHTLEASSLDSTNVTPEHWLYFASIIEKNYDEYDGFLLTHGTDTMAYTSAGLYYLIRRSRKPVVLTGSQRPIDSPDTDAVRNLTDSIRYLIDPRAKGVCICFGGAVIRGNAARKAYTQSDAAFESISAEPIAYLTEDSVVFTSVETFEDTYEESVLFFRKLDTKVLVYKVVPGMDGTVLKALEKDYHGLILEGFGVGDLPEYGDPSVQDAAAYWLSQGKPVTITTQCGYEGTSLSVYEVGRKLLKLGAEEGKDLPTEALYAEMMQRLADQ